MSDIRSSDKTDTVHYLIYVVGVWGLYLINFFRVNGTGAQWAFGNECIGVILFIFILLRMKNNDIRHWVYLAWISLSIVGCLIHFKFYRYGTDYDYKLIGQYVNLILCGVLCILFIRKMRGDSDFLHNFRKCSIVFVFWFILIVICIVSKNESKWPLWALIMLGSHYIVPVEEQEKRLLIRGVIDGIIVCFFIYEGHALLFRPYEIAWIRYCGFFSNSDCCAKFFTASYIGFLCKYLLLREDGKGRIRRILALAFAGSMWGFVFFTMTRSGFVGLFFSTLAFAMVYHYKCGGFVKNGIQAIIVASFLISIPVIFVSIRYIPALRHHPIFIGAYDESRVHSYDPIDSDKYVDWQDVIGAYVSKVDMDNMIAERFVNHVVSVLHKYTFNQELYDEYIASDKSIAEPLIVSSNGERVIQYIDGVEPGKDSKHPVFIAFSYNNPIEKLLGIRKYVYSYYLLKAGWFGNESEYVSGYVNSEVAYTSAHNSTLDFMSRYGYIAGVLYFLLQVTVCGYSVIILKNQSKKMDMGITLAVITCAAYLGWGLFYSVAFTGEILDSLFWITIAFVIIKPESFDCKRLAES